MVQPSISASYHQLNPSVRLRTFVNVTRGIHFCANVLIKKNYIPKNYQNQTVTDPAVSSIKVKFPVSLGPPFVVSARPGLIGVTVEDVILTLGAYVDDRITQPDFRTLPPYLQTVMSQAFHQRICKNPHLHSIGILRVDALGDSIFFVGLRPSASDPQAFEPMFVTAQDVRGFL